MAKANVQPPKGTRDYLPHSVRQRRYAIGIIEQVYEAHGFEPLETPALERLEALTGKYGDEGDQLMFRVLLRGQPLVKGIERAAQHIAEPGALVTGRSGQTAPGAASLLADMGLRYDLTVPLARAHAANASKLPQIFKRYQTQPVWRADTPGKGRYREFFQCDLDVVGSASPVVEAEVAEAGCECLVRLGFTDFKLRTNHRGVLRAIVDRAGLPAEQEINAIAALDKLDKVGASGVDAELASRGIAEGPRKALLKLITGGVTLDRVREFLSGHVEGEKAVAELQEVFDLCQHTAAAQYMVFDVSLARGLGYYTGCIFEFSTSRFGGSIGGGGRYDGLIGMFTGKSVPACGLSLGLERLLLLMEEAQLFPTDLGAIDVLMATTAGQSPGRALALAGQLRAAGLSVSLSPKSEKPGKLRKAAAERQAAFAVWWEEGHVHYWQRSTNKIARNLSAEQAGAEVLQAAGLSAAAAD